MLEPHVRRFLASAGWGAAAAAPLAGDASARRYLRLVRPGGDRAVLMLAPPAPDDSTARFVAVAEALRQRGFAAPEVFAAEPQAGLVLTEDLGDDLFARVIAAAPAQERALYEAAVDCLAALHAAPSPSDLPRLAPAGLVAMTAPAADWYVGQGTEHPALAAAIAAALRPPLEALADAAPTVLVHRDFHAENLVWRPARTGLARVGLLDFQDAVRGPAGYDLVSLIADARRDLAPGLAAALTARFAAQTGLAPEALEARRAILSAQRNLRILGVFARLALRHGKPRYVALLPRVWWHLQSALTHPELADLRAVVDRGLPPPEPALCAALST